MSHNNGKIYENPTKETIDKQQELAEDFSEGNPLLKELLLKLWQNKINTRGCCNGHIDENIPWYITITIDKKSICLVNEIANFIEENIISDNKLEFRIHFNGALKHFHIMIFSDIKNRDLIIKTISSYIDKVNNNENSQNLNTPLYGALSLVKLAKKRNYALNFNCMANCYREYPEEEISFDFEPIKEVDDIRKAYEQHGLKEMGEEIINGMKEANQKYIISVPSEEIQLSKILEELKNINFIVHPSYFIRGTIKELKEYLHLAFPENDRFKNDQKKESI